MVVKLTIPFSSLFLSVLLHLHVYFFLYFPPISQFIISLLLLCFCIFHHFRSIYSFSRVFCIVIFSSSLYLHSFLLLCIFYTSMCIIFSLSLFSFSFVSSSCLLLCILIVSSSSFSFVIFFMAFVVCSIPSSPPLLFLPSPSPLPLSFYYCPPCPP